MNYLALILTFASLLPVAAEDISAVVADVKNREGGAAILKDALATINGIGAQIEKAL